MLSSRKDTGSTEEKARTKTGLIRPRIAEEQKSPVPNAAEKADKVKSDEKKSAMAAEKSDEKPARATQTVTSLDKKNGDKTSSPEKKPTELIKPLRQASEDALPAKTESVQPEKNPKSDSDKQASTARANKTKDSEEIPLKKHDHSKYVAAIKGKAIDRVNKSSNVDLARICRDTTTDEWSLTLYHKREKAYSFVSYIWDEIDEKWEEAFSSDQRPIAGWKQHLNFSSAGKKCDVIKGRLP